MQDSEPHARRRRVRIAVPTRGDALLSRMTEVVGGPLGRRSAPGVVSPGFFTVERVLIIMVVASGILAVLLKFHCRQSGWSTPDQYSTTCWSEIPNVFKEKGLAVFFPYFGPNATFDYPPLTGEVAGITAWLTTAAGVGAPRQLAFFDLNAVLIIAMWILAVVATARTARRRPWDAAIVAASPVLLFTALTSWDMWAVGLVSVGMLLFARRRNVAGGAVLGLAVCAQPYALLILVALLMLSIRTRRWLPLLEAVTAAVVAWLVIMLPVLVLNFGTWRAYLNIGLDNQPSESSIYKAYKLVAERLGGAGMGTVAVDLAQLILLTLAVLGIGWLALAAPRRPRLAQLAFLLVAAYCLTDKHAAPQHVLWLLPLLALARPKWRTVLSWQAVEVLHYLALLLFLGRELGDGNAQHAIDMPYFVLAVLLHVGATLAVMALVVREILRPESDVVRRLGSDDPQAGMLEFAPDRFTVGTGWSRVVLNGTKALNGTAGAEFTQGSTPESVDCGGTNPSRTSHANMTHSSTNHASTDEASTDHASTDEASMNHDSMDPVD
ncbi:MAG: glycosyltransferase 87 family protein [Actinomycetota bacterium]|nr:glycosyltransferase 87 family protein [Actinomycetota bacterium]